MNIKHTHRYYRDKFKKSEKIIFRCSIPGCSHYVFEEMAAGKISICNRCDEKFMLTIQNMKLKKPHCGNCNKPEVKKDVGIDMLIGSLFNGDD